MSTIAVNAITDANAGNTTTINGVTPNSANVVGKNLIINGAMQIAQRGTSTTGITSGATYPACDRFQFILGTIGTYTVSQDTDSPDGFSNSFKIDCTTADASPAAGDYLIFYQKIEGQMCQQLAKGTASAKPVTLSFWVKSNKTGNMQVNIRDMDNARLIGNIVTINSAATWEKISLTFAGDTTGALNNDKNNSLQLEWWLDSGSDSSSGSVPTSWQANADADRNAGGTLALADSTSNYINITGVQLEVGESATEFEHRPYTTELALCQRYFLLISSGLNKPIGMGAMYTATFLASVVSFPVTMRANPTIYQVTGTNHFIFFRNGDSDQFNSFTLNTTNPYGFEFFNNTQISGVAGHSGFVRCNNAAAVFGAQAEL